MKFFAFNPPNAIPAGFLCPTPAGSPLFSLVWLPGSGGFDHLQRAGAVTGCKNSLAGSRGSTNKYSIQ